MNRDNHNKVPPGMLAGSQVDRSQSLNLLKESTEVALLDSDAATDRNAWNAWMFSENLQLTPRNLNRSLTKGGTKVQLLPHQGRWPELNIDPKILDLPSPHSPR